LAVLGELGVLVAQVAEPAEKGFELTNELAVKVLSIAAPIVGLLSGLVAWLSHRAARVENSSNPPFRILRLRTKNTELDIISRGDYFGLLATLAVALLFIVFFLYVFISNGIAGFGWLAVAELVLFGVLSVVYIILLLTEARPGEPADSWKAELLVEGDFAEVVGHCQTALLQIGAFAPEGVRLSNDSMTKALLRGRTGSLWSPRAGERVRIDISSTEPGMTVVSLESLTLSPRLFRRGANKRNVRHLIERLV
jgi:hypothetical protein